MSGWMPPERPLSVLSFVSLDMLYAPCVCLRLICVYVCGVCPYIEWSGLCACSPPSHALSLSRLLSLALLASSAYLA